MAPPSAPGGLSVSRRVSYIIPPPVEPRTKLVLPPLDTNRRGHTVPFVIPDPNQPVDHSFQSSFSADLEGTSTSSRRRSFSPRSSHSPKQSRAVTNSSAAVPPPVQAQPRHRLGVSALALDLSTHISGKTSPEGILYSAGRDGLIIATELSLPTRPRRRRNSFNPERRGRTGRRAWKGDWTTLTGWDEDEDTPSSDEDDADDEELEFALDEPSLSLSGGTYGSAPRSAGRSRTLSGVDKSLPYEKRWEVDFDRVDEYEPVKPSAPILAVGRISLNTCHYSVLRFVNVYNPIMTG